MDAPGIPTLCTSPHQEVSHTLLLTPPPTHPTPFRFVLFAKHPVLVPLATLLSIPDDHNCPAADFSCGHVHRDSSTLPGLSPSPRTGSLHSLHSRAPRLTSEHLDFSQLRYGLRRAAHYHRHHFSINKRPHTLTKPWFQSTSPRRPLHLVTAKDQRKG